MCSVIMHICMCHHAYVDTVMAMYSKSRILTVRRAERRKPQRIYLVFPDFMQI